MGSARVSDGFTLVELLVVLAILALVTAVAGPALGTALRRAEKPKGPDQLRAELVAARRLAVRSGQPVRFEIDAASGSFEMVASRGGRDTSLMAGTIHGWTPWIQGDGQVWFYPSGLARPAAWTWPEGTDTAVIAVEPLDGSISLVR